MVSPEQHTNRPGNTLRNSTEQAGGEQLDYSSTQNKERSHENPESRSAEKEHALEEAKKEALATPEQGGAEKEESHHDSSPKSASKQQRERTYRQTMTHIQAEMSPAQRTFSKIIHHPAIEKTSDVVGNTVARPNAILSGSICAFILVLCLYINARYMGYALSGFETIGAFLLGWIIGVLFDLLRFSFRNKR